MWTFFCISVVAVLLLVLWLQELKRDGALRAMVIRRRFTYIGQVLPRSLTLHGTPLERASSVWNVFEGDCGGIRVIAFDYSIGYGKGGRRRTAIAAQSPRDVFGAAKFISDLTVARSGDWAIMYEQETISLVNPGLMPVPEIEAHLDSIGS